MAEHPACFYTDGKEQLRAEETKEAGVRDNSWNVVLEFAKKDAISSTRVQLTFAKDTESSPLVAEGRPACMYTD